MQKLFMRLGEWVGDRLVTLEDTETIRARKIALTSVQVFGLLLLAVWSGLFRAQGFDLSALVALVALGLYVGNVLGMFVTKNLRLHIYLAITFLWLYVVAIHISLGGFVQSGYVMIWAIFLPLLSSLILERRDTIMWAVVFIFTLAGMAIVEPQISQFNLDVDYDVSLFSGIMNIFNVAVIVVSLNLYLVSRLDEARHRADDLLLNILPAEIAEQLKHDRGTIANSYSEVTVLFADIVDFTQLSSGTDSETVVNMLNDVFSDFDRLTDKHDLEKIKTIGDAYMVAGGLPIPRDDHAEAVVEMALEMLEVLEDHKAWNGAPIRVRVGINSGPVVAGVIGRQKFIYDLWGDVVNTASRMESNGVGGEIQVTESTKAKLGGKYIFEAREPIFIKGKGEMVTYLLKGRV